MIPHQIPPALPPPTLQASTAVTAVAFQPTTSLALAVATNVLPAQQISLTLATQLIPHGSKYFVSVFVHLSAVQTLSFLLHSSVFPFRLTFSTNFYQPSFL